MFSFNGLKKTAGFTLKNWIKISDFMRIVVSHGSIEFCIKRLMEVL